MKPSAPLASAGGAGDPEAERCGEKDLSSEVAGLSSPGDGAMRGYSVMRSGLPRGPARALLESPGPKEDAKATPEASAAGQAAASSFSSEARPPASVNAPAQKRKQRRETLPGLRGAFVKCKSLRRPLSLAGAEDALPEVAMVAAPASATPQLSERAEGSMLAAAVPLRQQFEAHPPHQHCYPLSF